jgi:hypothetical protein
MNRPVAIKRRHLLVRSLAMAGSSLFVLSAGMRSVAAQKSSKASLLYQDHPHEGKRCGECKYFGAPSDASGAGTCALVEGPVQPDGWCMAFSPRQ